MFRNCGTSVDSKHLSVSGKVVRTIGVALFGLGLAGSGVSAIAKPVPDVSAGASAKSLNSALPGKPGIAYGILGSLELKTIKHRFEKDWRDVMARFEAERKGYARCRNEGGNCPPKLRQWLRLIDDLQGLPKPEQLSKLTRSLNRMVRYAEDSVAFGKQDYWATPLEFFQKGGDCEDYAFVKFVSLLELGFSSDQLRVAIVKDKRRRLMHAVTTVALDDKVFVLDNLNDYPVQHQYVLKYVPLYSVNLDAQWVHIVTNKMRAAFITQVLGKTAKSRKTKRAISATARLSQLLDSR